MYEIPSHFVAVITLCCRAAVNLPLLDQAEVEDVEEELPDGLEDACSQDEEGEEEDGEGL